MKLWPVLVTLLAGSALAEEAAPEATEPRPVVSEIVNLQDALSIAYVGTVAAKVQVDLGFPIAGTIAERPVSLGDIVAEGSVLARLESTDLDAGVRAAEAGVAVAEAQANTARDARGRAKELAARGAGAQTQLDDAERALVAAEARLEQARAARARAQDLLQLATLKAPQAGIVTLTHQEPGAVLSAGQPVLQLSGTDEREVVIDLSEEDAAALPPGAEFIASLVANPAIAVRATLDRIDPVAEKNTRTRRAHLRLISPPIAFRLGALVHSAHAPVAGETTGAAIVLPLSAVLDPDGKAAVWVVDRSDDTAHLMPVTLSAQFSGVAIIASGLSAGDEIITRGIHSLQDGQKVGLRVSE
ncbi:efflux RND transporter periplasmic adaptor subunit [Frigidibacter sp. RF13]|uniref:efflux RND transporter periplasmic adaptor subunit n=1 Tax=Frigidibacter sp. RF13 TaxID=2997340 RepID=UPI00226F73BE|nr:efflux RND transporter periplasmic adaptor subunit [Frigidibacter sp. RF13]MCY1126498.1 efflux RND transporter periplasmic adaptor subunit [Frigidibacter sp. RF13]